MSLYQFAPNSPVASIQFRYALNRAPEALLSAGAGVPPQQLIAITKALRGFGLECTPASANGKEILQVSGFKDAEQLTAFLHMRQFSLGEPTIVHDGDQPQKTVGTWLEHNSLRAAGWLNLIGDVFMLGSGIRHGDAEKMSAGALYTAGATVAAMYGNVRTERQVQEVLNKTTQFLEKQALELPPESGLEAIAQRRRHKLGDTRDFLSHYPAEMMLGAYTAGAFMMLQSGLRKRGPNGKLLNPWNLAYGASSLGLKATSLLIPEHRMTPEEKLEAQNHSPIRKIVDWIQEKPLRLFGYGSFVSDTLLALSAYRDHKNNPQAKADIMMWITTGTYMVADILAAISSKKPANADGRFSDDEQRRIIAPVAETIAAQPPEMQNALVNQIAGFLAMQPEIEGNATKLSAAIAEQMQHLKQNPWAQRVRMPTPANDLTSPDAASAAAAR